MSQVAELVRRGLLLPERLPDVLPILTQALRFEQQTPRPATQAISAVLKAGETV